MGPVRITISESDEAAASGNCKVKCPCDEPDRSHQESAVTGIYTDGEVCSAGRNDMAWRGEVCLIISGGM